MANSTYTIHEMHDYARIAGGVCMGGEIIIDWWDKLKWKCKRGHIFEMLPTLVQQGAWCPRCQKTDERKQYQMERLQKIAESRGGKVVSSEYINKRTEVTFQCSKGHKWEALPSLILVGKSWCPDCADKEDRANRNQRLERLKTIAAGRGGKCLSDEYINNATKLKFECKEGHVWETVPAVILSKRHWCPYCAGCVQKTLEEMQAFAAQKGGRCLSEEYINANTRMKWECDKGHVWEATPATIIWIGCWCPKCNGVEKLTIEEMRELASKKGGKCLSDTYINSHTHLKWECDKGHVWEAVPGSVKAGKWCRQCAGHKKLTIEEMHKLASQKGGKCLSKEYISNDSKLKWQCKKGHVWEGTPNNIKNGKRWCAKCAGKERLTIEEMHAIATGKEGRCLSHEYVNNQTKLRWQCKEGHVWEAAPSPVKQGSWCPDCKREKMRHHMRNLRRTMPERFNKKLTG